MKTNNFITAYLKETAEIANNLDREAIKRMIEVLNRIRKDKGRIFFLGTGGGADRKSVV